MGKESGKKNSKMTNTLRLRRSAEGEARAQNKFESLRNSMIEAKKLELTELYEKEDVNLLKDRDP